MEEIGKEEIDEEIAEFVSDVQACEKFDVESLTWIESRSKNLRKKIETLMEAENE